MNVLKFEYLSKESIRVDKYLESICENFSRSFIQKLINDSCLRVNDIAVTKSSFKLHGGEKLVLSVPSAKDVDIYPVDLGLDLIYEDENYMIVNKPTGLTVHPGSGVAGHEPTLVHGIMYMVKDLSGIGGELRPGIVHRLDKGTSGVIMICKNDQSHKYYSEKFKKREMSKDYYALVYGTTKKKQGVYESKIGRSPLNRIKMVSNGLIAKEAVTLYQAVKDYKFFTLVKASPKTGRTHQIRVHMSENGNPIVGDEVYINKNVINNIMTKIKNFDTQILKVNSIVTRLMLHSYSLAFIDQDGRSQKFEAPIPDDFQKVLEFLETN